MRPARLVPVLAGLAASGITFALVLSLDGNGGERSERRSAVASVGKEVFARMGCGSCHTLAAAGSSGVIGPELDRLPGYTRESLIRTILDPPAPEGAFSPMPQDFGSRMSRQELRTLADFVLGRR